MCYSLIWNYGCSHVLHLVFTIVEAKCGIVRPEERTFFEHNSSDSGNEDVVKTFPKPSIQGVSRPAFPSPEPLPKPLKSLAGLGLTKVSCSVLFLTFFFCAFSHTSPLILTVMKRIPYRNGIPQDHDRKQCNNKSNICAGLRFMNVGGSKPFWSMPLWKERMRKQLERTTRWIWRWGGGWRGIIHLRRTRWI